MTATETEVRPTHLIAFPGDRRTLCGRKTRNVTMVMLARMVGRHQRGHPETFAVCADCESNAVDHDIALDDGESDA